MTSSSIRVVRIVEVCNKTGLSKSAICYKLDTKNRRHDPDFPKPFRLSNTGRAIGWLESEIDEYIAKQAANHI